MNNYKANIKDQIGNSIYQIECKKYYKILRDLHNAVFTSTERMKSEKTEERYSGGNVPGIENLYTFITMMEQLLKGKKSINGIDYGCGCHYFADDMARNNHWNVIGYDSDEYAIGRAKEKYPYSAERYILCDLLKDGIPSADQSQDFVFCNAVIQHFSDEEAEKCFNDISRVLKKSGLFVVIFKNKIDDMVSFAKTEGLEINIIDEAAGKIEIEDRTMKKAAEKIKLSSLKMLLSIYQRGMRLFHFYSLQEIVEIGKKMKFTIIEDIPISNDTKTRGVFTYYSGKKIPTAALFFRKVL
jgi:ubiquinone/menaquinone biosynthesis C-methylase UbiE